MTTPQDMDRLITEHLAAEMSGDPAGAVAVYTGDVEHDVVGWPAGPAHGREAAQHFYDELLANFTTESMKVTKQLYGPDFCVVEHDVSGTVHGCCWASLRTASESPTACFTCSSSATGRSAARTCGSTAAPWWRS